VQPGKQAQQADQPVKVTTYGSGFPLPPSVTSIEPHLRWQKHSTRNKEQLRIIKPDRFFPKKGRSATQK